MTTLNLIRVVFIIICAVLGYILGENSLFFSFLGAVVGVTIVIFEVLARRISLKGLSAAVFGIILGLIIAHLIGNFLTLFKLPSEMDYFLRSFLTLIFVYLGLTLGLKGKEEFHLVIPYVRFKREELREEPIVVDTSSIIDGRILDIVRCGFLEAKLIIPRFVLKELQVLADSTEHLKRQRGKRGIEILNALKKEKNIEVVISEEDFEDLAGVDAKIIRLAKILEAKVFTTDYNLNRLAQLEGVKVLNVNDLANALKPIFLPGEKISIKLIKEGKEPNQAVGYLDDGTMVVVENARWLIGKTVEVEVTSILQSPSGRIIFTRLSG